MQVEDGHVGLGLVLGVVHESETPTWKSRWKARFRASACSR